MSGQDPTSTGNTTDDRRPLHADPRLAALEAWLRDTVGLSWDAIAPASADASFRRYFRVQCTDVSYVAMDAPPDKEESRPFIEIALRLGSHAVHVPQIYRYDIERGFLLLSDLGNRDYLGALNADTVEGLYADALDCLLRIQMTQCDGLPPYDDILLRRELSLFEDWLLRRHLGIELSAPQTGALHRVFDALVQAALSQPRVFVHRDYHSRNLMVAPVNNPGVLDFQDAVIGPVTYDLVSLLRDCYIAWPRERVEAWALDHRDRSAQAGVIDKIDDEQFLRWFDLMGVQRHLKAIGIFARLYRRDGKPGYLTDIPRTLGYILEIGPRYSATSGLAELIETLGLLDRVTA